jgi:hypothetical protein
MRSGKDELISGSSLSMGNIPVGVIATDDATGLGKIITFNSGGTTPTGLYKIVVSAQEQLITDVDDPFLKNANLSESTAQKVRLNIKINIVLDSLQSSSPLPYTNDTNQANLVNDIVVSPGAAVNGEQISLTLLSGSAAIDGRDLEIVVRNDPGIGGGNPIPNGSTDQQAFFNGKLVDSLGTEYHLNAIFNDVVSTNVVLRIDKEPGQPNPSIINGSPYTLRKRDVYVTDQTNGSPQGKLFWPIAKVNWDSGAGIVHESKITDLRSTTIPSLDFQTKTNQKLDIVTSGGTNLSYNSTSQLITWSSAITLTNPHGLDQTIPATSNPLMDGGSLVYDLNILAGGSINRGTLALTITSGGTTITVSSTSLDTLRIGNVIVDSVGTLASVTAINDVTDQITLSNALVAGAAIAYLDSYASGTAPLSANSYVLATRKGSELLVKNNLAANYSSDIRGVAGQGVTQRLGVLTDAIGDEQEDRSAYLRSDDVITWTGTDLQFTADIVLEIINTKTGVVTNHKVAVADSPIVLQNLESAWILIDRTQTNETVTLNTSVTTPIPAQTQANKDVVVLFRRVDAGAVNYLHIPLHKQTLAANDVVRLGTTAAGGITVFDITQILVSLDDGNVVTSLDGTVLLV